MQYLCLIYTNEADDAARSDAERGEVFAAYGAYTKGIKESGAFVGGDALQPTATATTVRYTDGKRMLTDGPFAETREQLGGYYLVEAKDLDEAIEIASGIPAVHHGCVEVRPLLSY